ncbi:MAG: ATP-binding protein, partial [Pseudoalteromonas nigrifaciens]
SITLKMDLLPSDTSEQQHICFKVIDTGVGIDKADQRRLFDAFTQGDESSTRTHHGVGLGLAIVKSAVLLMGGEIALNSEKGEGCEFYFSVLLDVVPACKQLPDNTLVILSAHSHELTQVINAFPTLTYTNLEQLLKSPREHLKAKQLIIGAA